MRPRRDEVWLGKAMDVEGHETQMQPMAQAVPELQAGVAITTGLTVPLQTLAGTACQARCACGLAQDSHP